MNKNRLIKALVCGGLAAGMLAPMSGCVVVVGGDNDRDSYRSSDRDGKRIGVEVDSVRSAVGAQAGVMPGTGLVVTRVIAGSPAAAAGMQQYDVIKGVEGQPDGTLSSLRAALKAKNAGETVTLTIVRGGQEMSVTPTVASFHD